MENSCCGFESAHSCNAAAKPSGRTECRWDASNTRCSTILAAECLVDNAPCACFEAESSCDAANIEGDLDCEWSGALSECVLTGCVQKTECRCLQTPRDCVETEIVDFPGECVWSDDSECVEQTTTTTTTTEEPRQFESTSTTRMTTTMTSSSSTTDYPSRSPTRRPTASPHRIWSRTWNLYGWRARRNTHWSR